MPAFPCIATWSILTTPPKSTMRCCALSMVAAHHMSFPFIIGCPGPRLLVEAVNFTLLFEVIYDGHAGDCVVGAG